MLGWALVAGEEDEVLSPSTNEHCMPRGTVLHKGHIPEN